VKSTTTTSSTGSPPPEAGGEDRGPLDVTEPAEGQSRLRRFAQRGLGPLVSVVSLIGVIWWISHQSAPHFPTSSHGIGLLFAALGVVCVALALRGWRWHAILRHDGIEHRRGDAMAICAIGMMGNTVLVARGGELLRVLILSRRVKARYSEVLGTIVAERLMDAIVLGSLVVIMTFAGVKGAPADNTAAVLTAAGLGVAALVVYVYLRLRIRGRFEVFAERIRPFARQTRKLLGVYGVWLALVSAVIWSLDGLTFFLVAHALKLGIGYLAAYAMAVLASAFASIPAAPGFAGTWDAGVVVGLSALKIKGSAAVSFLLLTRFLIFVPPAAIGLIALITRYGGFAAQRGRAAEAGTPIEAGAAAGTERVT
jgi:uncharacterized protein (TIRG00374 family)